tara:strand:- start:44 stop:565 length:522 start_codon:yes stop_codon:yes gene_type:complete
MTEKEHKRTMPNYNESMIYKLCCLDTTIEEIYIGSTTNFRRRKTEHKRDSNTINRRGYNRNVYKFIRDNGGWDNWDMILIAKVNCNDKMELRQKEREFMEEYKPFLNMFSAYTTYEEKLKHDIEKYHNDEKWKLNKLEKRRGKITCGCGSIIAKVNISTHRKTKKHINFINTI